MLMTNDARIIVGTLVGWDHMTNLILANSHERIFSPNESVKMLNLGIFVVRGDNVALLGQVDPELDAAVSWDDIKVGPVAAINI